MESLLFRTFELANKLIKSELENGLMPKVAPEQLKQGLDLTLPEDGNSEDIVFEKMEAVLQATPQTSNARFLNQLFGGREKTAAAADMLTALTNVSMYTFKSAGVQILIEQQLINHMASFAGFKEAEGIICPGGSLANLMGMMMGRDYANPNFRETGNDSRRHTFYVSEECHYSVNKGAAVLGVGRKNVRKIKCNGSGEILTQELELQLQKDLQKGYVPCAVIATSGTTVLGAFDPIEKLADICEQYNVWLHVDGAFGGAALLHHEYRKLLKGLERADSFVWDAHKVMGIPLTCSILLCQRKGQLSKSIKEDAQYLFQADNDELNPGVRSIQCGRRNDAFKLWAAWQALGDNGWGERLERQMNLAKIAATYIKESDVLELCQWPDFLTICFKVNGIDAIKACELLHEEGQAIISHAKVRNQNVIRLVTINPDTSPEQIQATLQNIESKQSKLITAQSI
jgi:sulfinoalanine decarboxylase